MQLKITQVTKNKFRLSYNYKFNDYDYPVSDIDQGVQMDNWKVGQTATRLANELWSRTYGSKTSFRQKSSLNRKCEFRSSGVLVIGNNSPKPNHTQIIITIVQIIWDLEKPPHKSTHMVILRETIKSMIQTNYTLNSSVAAHNKHQKHLYFYLIIAL